MINQVFYYSLELFSFNSISVSINALFLIVLLIVTSIINNKYCKSLSKILYLIILLGFLKVLIFSYGDNAFFEKGSLSKISFFIYNILNYPLASAHTFFMAYSYLFLILFIPFQFIFQKTKWFIIFVLCCEITKMLFNILGIGNEYFSFYNVILYTLGYVIGYFIWKFSLKKN